MHHPRKLSLEHERIGGPESGPNDIQDVVAVN